jgi:predicted transcriptional regulator
MKIIELKSDLHQLIDNINDVTILNAVKVLLSKKEEGSDWWNEISEAERKLIEQGLAEADRGEFIPHEQVMKEARAKYKLGE